MQHLIRAALAIGVAVVLLQSTGATQARLYDSVSTGKVTFATGFMRFDSMQDAGTQCFWSWNGMEEPIDFDEKLSPVNPNYYDDSNAKAYIKCVFARDTRGSGNNLRINARALINKGFLKKNLPNGIRDNPILITGFDLTPVYMTRTSPNVGYTVQTNLDKLPEADASKRPEPPTLPLIEQATGGSLSGSFGTYLLAAEAPTWPIKPPAHPAGELISLGSSITLVYDPRLCEGWSPSRPKDCAAGHSLKDFVDFNQVVMTMNQIKG